MIHDHTTKVAMTLRQTPLFALPSDPELKLVAARSTTISYIWWAVVFRRWALQGAVRRYGRANPHFQEFSNRSRTGARDWRRREISCRTSGFRCRCRGL